MKEETIREFSGKILAFVEIDSSGNKTLKNFARQIIGKYNVSDNTTRDFYGRILYYGDALAALLNRC